MKKSTILFIGLMLIIVASSCSNNYYSLEDWKVNRNRAKQIDPLIKSKILIGKTYDEVIQILGTEKLSDMWKDTADLDKQFMVRYFTGKVSYIAFESLDIVFKSRKVIDVRKEYD